MQHAIVKFFTETKPCNLMSNLGIRCQYLESMVDLPLSYSTTDIQEVCWYTTVQLYQIHSCHGKPSTID